MLLCDPLYAQLFLCFLFLFFQSNDFLTFIFELRMMTPMDRQNLYSVTINRPFCLKMVKFEAYKNRHFHTKERVFLLICPQLFFYRTILVTICSEGYFEVYFLFGDYFGDYFQFGNYFLKK